MIHGLMPAIKIRVRQLAFTFENMQPINCNLLKSFQIIISSNKASSTLSYALSSKDTITGAIVATEKCSRDASVLKALFSRNANMKNFVPAMMTRSF
mmetsp:Transcript_19821/g.33158  ORF Transcript_19821/g.33158 Transcript_19821/m.33158 type:complete len:97 (-) Transcript_19821:446-736(-)